MRKAEAWKLTKEIDMGGEKRLEIILPMEKQK